LPQPLDYRQIVALFSDHREAGLHAMLYGQVHQVRCEPGLLELRVDASVPANFAGRVGQCLHEWTGQRWVVSIVSAEGCATLAEQDRAIEAARRERAKAHPLMQAVFTAFPDAKMTALRHIGVASVPPASDDEATPTEPEIFSNELED
jgi:DNA polymerase-3 subunit gamma/tau